MSLASIDLLLAPSGRASLESAAAEIRGRAQGRVGLAEDIGDLSGVYDSIVSIVAIAAAPDPLDLIEGLREHLCPNGRLHFLEPIGTSGPAARIKAGLASPIVARTGVAFDRAIPGLLRIAEFTVVDIQRIRPATRLPLPGLFARGTARLRPTYRSG